MLNSVNSIEDIGTACMDEIDGKKLLYIVGGYFNPLDALYTPICSPKVAFNAPCSLGGVFSGGGGGGAF